jgi:hypothetical protein
MFDNDLNAPQYCADELPDNVSGLVNKAFRFSSF